MQAKDDGTANAWSSLSGLADFPTLAEVEAAQPRRAKNADGYVGIGKRYIGPPCAECGLTSYFLKTKAQYLVYERDGTCQRCQALESCGDAEGDHRYCCRPKWLHQVVEEVEA